MRILRVIARLNVGGPARHVVLLDRGLRARGHDTLLVHGSVSEGEASFAHLGAGAGLPMLAIPTLGRRISPAADAATLTALIRLLFRYRPDVVHTHTAKAGALGRVAALLYNRLQPRARRCAVVHTFHGHVFSGYFNAAASLLIRSTEGVLARCTDRVVVISRRQQEEIVRTFRVARHDRTALVELGLDLEPLLALPVAGPGLRPALGIDPGAIVVGYVGRLVPIKDLATMLDAVAAARASVPGLVLVVAGDGPERPRLQARAAELGIARAVHWLGWTEDLGAVYQTMDVCALSSLNEGTPVALIEAMAAGRPVVATSVGGVPDVVEDGRAGFLVGPRDAGALAAAIGRLARDAEARRRMGEAGRSAVATRFGHERLVDDIERLYRQLVAAQGIRGARG